MFNINVDPNAYAERSATDSNNNQNGEIIYNGGNGLYEEPTRSTNNNLNWMNSMYGSVPNQQNNRSIADFYRPK